MGLLPVVLLLFLLLLLLLHAAVKTLTDDEYLLNEYWLFFCLLFVSPTLRSGQRRDCVFK